MRRGFTILELLVASLLMGMLMTILTMIFNQSSIAWRTGTAQQVDLNDVRRNTAIIREESDSLYLWEGQAYRTLSVWDDKGVMRQRAINVNGGTGNDGVNMLSGISDNPSTQLKMMSVGSGQESNNRNNYIVNVKSVGPDGEKNTWDDIWSSPDDFD